MGQLKAIFMPAALMAFSQTTGLCGSLCLAVHQFSKLVFQSLTDSQLPSTSNESLFWLRWLSPLVWIAAMSSDGLSHFEHEWGGGCSVVSQLVREEQDGMCFWLILKRTFSPSTTLFCTQKTLSICLLPVALLMVFHTSWLPSHQLESHAILYCSAIFMCLNTFTWCLILRKHLHMGRWFCCSFISNLN